MHNVEETIKSSVPLLCVLAWQVKGKSLIDSTFDCLQIKLAVLNEVQITYQWRGGLGYCAKHVRQYIAVCCECAAESQPCGHHWQYRDTAKRQEYQGFHTAYFRTDFYYCTKCLENKEIKQQKQSRDMPDWYLAERV